MLKISTIFFCCFLYTNVARAQNDSVASQLSNHIAQKMKDTLGLSVQKQDQIYSINMNLHAQKSAIRQQYSHQDSIRVKIQRIENTRDSLYHTVISDSLYLIYRQKKPKLVTKN
jgi:hypothetical protein